LVGFEGTDFQVLSADSKEAHIPFYPFSSDVETPYDIPVLSLMSRIQILEYAEQTSADQVQAVEPDDILNIRSPDATTEATRMSNTISKKVSD
jgi:hypothetical protein